MLVRGMEKKKRKMWREATTTRWKRERLLRGILRQGSMNSTVIGELGHLVFTYLTLRNVVCFKHRRLNEMVYSKINYHWIDTKKGENQRVCREILAFWNIGHLAFRYFILFNVPHSKYRKLNKILYSKTKYSNCRDQLMIQWYKFCEQSCSTYFLHNNLPICCTSPILSRISSLWLTMWEPGRWTWNVCDIIRDEYEEVTKTYRRSVKRWKIGTRAICTPRILTLQEWWLARVLHTSANKGNADQLVRN